MVVRDPQDRQAMNGVRARFLAQFGMTVRVKLFAIEQRVPLTIS